MLGIGLIEAVGLGIGSLNADAHLDSDGGWPTLEWLGLKSGLPLLVWLTSFLASFTLVGLAVQQSAELLIGEPLHWAIASATALPIGLSINAFISGIIARIIPGYESTVIESAALLQRRATVLEGTARRGSPARAKVIDQHGQAHYVMVEPHNDADSVAQGEIALLVRKEGPVFFVLPDASTPFQTI